MIKIELLYDGARIDYDPGDDYVFVITESVTTENVWSPIDNLATIVPFVFDPDGILYVMNQVVGTWGFSGGKIYLDGEDVEGCVLSISGDNLIFDEEYDAIAYAVVDNYNYHDVALNYWKGLDGNKHKFVKRQTLSKN